MKKIVYLHGFGSTGNSAKSQALKAAFGEENVIAPDLPINPEDVANAFREIVRANRGGDLVLVGTSLGGFYAQHFSSLYGFACVLVNPSTQPQVTMEKRIGANRNYSTGETFYVTEEMLHVWGQMQETTYIARKPEKVSLFLANDDDVLDPMLAMQNIPERAFTKVTADGGHRYDMHWDAVVEHVKALM